MKKRVLSSILAGVLVVSVFAGCGSKTEDNSQAAADNSTTPATEAAAEEALAFDASYKPFKQQKKDERRTIGSHLRHS